MFFDFSLKSSLLLFFFCHGIIFSILLFVKGIQNNNKPSLWLSAFVLLSGLYIAPFMLGYAGWYSKAGYRETLFYIPFQQVLLLPPVLFFYVKSLLDTSFRISQKDLVHFLPAIAYLIYSFFVFVMDNMVYEDVLYYRDGRDKDFSPWYQVAGFISWIVYSISSIRLYERYTRIAFEEVSFADAVLFKWVKRFLLALIIILVLRGLFFIINPEWAQFGKKFWYYLCFSILFYYISISGYVNSIQSIISFRTTDFASRVAKRGSFSTSMGAAESTDQMPPMTESMGQEELDEWKIKMNLLMNQDRLFNNPTLVLADIAERLQIHPKKVSQIVNLGYKMNFNDFVNQYRVQEGIAKMASGEHNLQTLLGLAFDCGFNSKSTFNRAFKKYTSLSPREFLEKNHHK